MLDRFRIPLVVISILITLYGAELFWTGKQTVDHERLEAKPQDVTLDELILHPPQRSYRWYRITDGGASIARGVLQDYGTLAPGAKNLPFFFYAPILRVQDASRTETSRRLQQERPPTFIVLRSKSKVLKTTHETLKRLEPGPARTIDAWLAQNQNDLVIRPPFTGVLIHRTSGRLDSVGANRVAAEFEDNGWVLLEGERPPLHESPQVAIGLALIMGIPTAWLFALLITGKFAPPDEDSLPLEVRTKPAVDEVPLSSASVMPSA